MLSLAKNNTPMTPSFKYLLAVLFSTILLKPSQAQYFEWAQQISGLSIYGPDVNDMTIDPDGNVYVIGSFLATIEIGNGTSNILNSGFGYDLFATKFNSSGQHLWSANIGGSQHVYGECISVDLNGNIYLSGVFIDTMDANPSPTQIYNLIGSSTETSMFIIKLNPYGNLIWAKKIDANYDAANHRNNNMKIDTENNIYIYGNFTGIKDVDPDPLSNYYIDENDGIDFVIKLDQNGQFKWVRQFPSSSGNGGTLCFALDNSNNIFLTSTFRDTTDFDPSQNSSMILVPDSGRTFLCKLNSNGELVSAWQFGKASSFPSHNYSDIFPSNVSVKNGNVYISGEFQGTVDFNPSPAAIDTISSTGISQTAENGFILKLDTSGTFEWAKKYGHSTTSNFAPIINSSLSIDNQENIYLSGDFADTMDFDPGLATYLLSPYIDTGTVFTVIYNLKLDADGNFVWAFRYASRGNERSKQLLTDDIGNVYNCGKFIDFIDLNPDSASTNILNAFNTSDVYIVKLSQDSCSNLAIQIDSIAEISCTSLGYISTHALNGQAPYNYVWNTTPAINDSVITPTHGGIYQLTVTAANSCTRSSSLHIESPGSISDFDLNANLVGSEFRFGFQAHTWLNAFNDGCIPVNGQLKVRYNATDFDLVSASPAPNNTSGDTLIWNFTNLSYNSPHLIPQLTLANFSEDTACFDVIMTPVAGDANPADNIKHYCFPVVGSYDPNDKQVYPQGACDEHYVEMDTKLTYTVRFQNTGTADAINVFILDTLDNNLDLNTVRVVGKSHDMITEVLPGNVLKFRFDNIHLPDSTTNEPESHGYVIFEVSPNQAISNGTVISNSSSIYFDFNEPVLTNTVFNTFVNTIPECVDYVSEVGGNKFLLSPNPTNGQLNIIGLKGNTSISITDLSGRLVWSGTSNGFVDISGYESGIYYISIESEGETGVYKAVKL